MKRVFLQILLLLTISFNVLCAEIKVPDFLGSVVDQANIFSVDERLNSYLIQYREQTGNQIAVLTIKDLEGEAIESFSIRVSEAWKVGQKDVNNGVLFVIATNNHRMRIEVGYGLEEKLTDYKSGMILRNITEPYFKANRYDEGVVKTINAITEIIGGNDSMVEQQKNSEKRNALSPFVMIILFFIFLKIARRNPGMLILGSMLMSSGRGGRGGGFGGFSGGGGGSFGGGGASGSW